MFHETVPKLWLHHHHLPWFPTMQVFRPQKNIGSFYRSINVENPYPVSQEENDLQIRWICNEVSYRMVPSDVC